MAGYATPAWSNGAAPAINAANLTALGQAAELAEHPYGVCTTAAATAAKTVTIDFSGTLSLFAGLTVRIKFNSANTAASPTLNVNSTGAIPIVYAGAAVGSGAWLAGSIVEFRYDGTNWNIESRPIDTSPVNGSTNLILSGGVYSALQGAPKGYSALVNGGNTTKLTFSANATGILIGSEGAQVNIYGATTGAILYPVRSGGGFQITVDAQDSFTVNVYNATGNALRFALLMVVGSLPTVT